MSRAPTTEDVRSRGQVWTPPWVAAAMAQFLAKKIGAARILDPAVGPGALLSACAQLAKPMGSITGFEIDASVLSSGTQITETEYPRMKITELRIQDFISSAIDTNYDAIIANPPYLRHHRVPASTKRECQRIAQQAIGQKIDARAGLHVFFLLKALTLLAPEGRLSFLLPSDVVQGVFAKHVWTGIARRYGITGILTFQGGAAAFPGVDTNALIVFIENSGPVATYVKATWAGPAGPELQAAIKRWDEEKVASSKYLTVEKRKLSEYLDRGLTRKKNYHVKAGVPFLELATTMRGIATGDNSFFCFTSKKITDTGLDLSLFVRCIGRTRDLDGPDVDGDLLERLDAKGRETFLLSIDHTVAMSSSLEKYLNLGQRTKVSEGALIKTRNPWFVMEKRQPPPILFTYLGRRANRFVTNRAQVVPLTGFLCVYPRAGVKTDSLIKALNHPATWEELSDLGKSYGNGAIKVEPGNLRKLIVPSEAICAAGLKSTTDGLF